jgi:hypothetical protein
VREDFERRSTRWLVINSAAELERAIAVMDTIVGPTLQLSTVPLSLVTENLLVLRYAEYASVLQRLLAVLKMHYSVHATALQMSTIGDGQDAER